MFNTTNIDVNNSNTFNYNINAVSGTLRKSHPKSKFTIRVLKETMLIFDEDKPPKLTRDNNVEIVILQVMLIGDNRALIEYVHRDDFEESKYNTDVN